VGIVPGFCFSWHRLLRRTLHRPVLYSAMRKTFLYIIVIICYAACRNPASEKKKILHDFDSINRSFENSNRQLLVESDVLMDSLLAKLARNGSDSLKVMHAVVQGFYQYMHEINSLFRMACSDSTGEKIPDDKKGNQPITNTFFDRPPGIYLLYYLSTAKKTLADNTSSEVIRKQIREIGKFPGNRSEYTGEQWREKFFRDVPPVAVITILNYFEKKIKDIEVEVLKEHFKM
jgi:hypothetical protein